MILYLCQQKMNGFNIVRLLFTLLAIELVHCSDRKVTVDFNPNYKCDPSDCKNFTTVYTRSEGAKDALHYFWDFAGKPGVLLAVTGPKARLNVDWDGFIWAKKTESIYFTESPTYTFAVVVSKIYEFNDVNDTGLITNVGPENINVLHTKHFRWDRKAHSQNDKYFELSMEGTNYCKDEQSATDDESCAARNGSVKLLLNRFWTLDHSDIMPHILHSENSTQIDIVVENFETNSTFNNSRFAVELLIIGDHSLNSTMTIDTKKTLDDEHTPGIFEMVQITTPVCEFVRDAENCDKPDGGGYLQWRPVSYTAADRNVTSSTNAEYYPLLTVKHHIESSADSLIAAFYGYKADNLLLQAVNVSLGGKGDGFYRTSHYSSWTFTIGYGNPPSEQFSLLVIMIISIGLGLPAIILIIAGIYMCARRRYKRRDQLSLNG